MYEDVVRLGLLLVSISPFTTKTLFMMVFTNTHSRSYYTISYISLTIFFFVILAIFFFVATIRRITFTRLLNSWILLVGLCCCSAGVWCVLEVAKMSLFYLCMQGCTFFLTHLCMNLYRLEVNNLYVYIYIIFANFPSMPNNPMPN